MWYNNQIIMAREFGTPGGDNPQDRNKNRRQLPEGAFWNHSEEGDGGTRIPKELSEKRVGEPAPLRSPREAYIRCREAISRVPDQIKQQAPRQTLEELSKLYEMQGQGSAIRELGELAEGTLYEDLTDDEVYQIPEVGSIYWRAAYLGDAAASERLHTLLQTEKNGALLHEYTRVPSESKLCGVIAACAQKDIPADTWIESYSLNPDDRAGLKLKYWWSNEKADTETRDTALRYREELTEEYLRGEGTTTLYAFKNVQFLFGIQEDNATKQQIFERFQQLPEELQAEGNQFDTETLYYLCDFATRYLNAKGVARPQDVAWIEEQVEQLSIGLNAAGHNPETISAYTQDTKLAIEKYRNNDAPTLIEKIDMLTGEQDILDQASETSGSLLNDREARLYDMAAEALSLDDTNAARTIITALGEDTAMANASARKLFESIETMEQLEAIKPDEMELLFKENLATFFETKRILLGDNVDDLENLVVSSQTTTAKKPLTLKENVQKYAIKRLYEVDADRGHDATSILIADAPDYDTVCVIAKNQIANGDVTGWETMFDKIGPDDLQAYADLALYANEAMKGEAEA